jgi:hypothetical protein
MSSQSASSQPTSSQSLSSQPSSQPPRGYIRLVLFPQPLPQDSFYLEISIAFVATVCLNPRKYLKYLGWCVLGVTGTVKDGEGNRIGSNGPLVDQAIYHYTIPDDQDAFAHAIDVEVIKTRALIPSQTTASRDDFRRELRERDGRCVWTGLLGTGMHIIPYARGDEARSHSYYLCELNPVLFSSGSKLLLATGLIQRTKISTHSLSTISGTAFTATVFFMRLTLTDDVSLSSKYAHSSRQSDHN